MTEQSMLMREALIPMTEAIKLLPGGRTGIATGYRYCTRGARGIDGKLHVLETIKSAKKRWSSAAAVQRFIIAINTPAAPEAAPSPKVRGRQAAAAKREVEELLGV